MKGMNKNTYLRSQGAAVIAIALGLLLIINPDFGTATVGIAVGAVLAVIGLGILVMSFLSWPVLGVWEIVIGIVALMAGAALIREPTLLGKLLGYVVSGALILRSIQTFGEAKKLQTLGYDQKWNRILALVMLGLGVVLFVVPLTSSRVLMRLVGTAVLVLGILNVGTQAKFAKRMRNAQKNGIVDADE